MENSLETLLENVMVLELVDWLVLEKELVTDLLLEKLMLETL